MCDIDLPTLTALSTPHTSPVSSSTAPNGSHTMDNEITSESTSIQQTVNVIPSTLLTDKPKANGDNQQSSTGTDNISHTIKHPAVTCSTQVSGRF